MPDLKSGQPRAWQRMLSGRRLDLVDPSPLDIEIDDIAHGLARVPRWNGQTLGQHIYSVAQHTLLVDEIFAAMNPTMDAKWRLAVLLHDAPEYVIGDLISPFKALLGGKYVAVERRLLEAIHRRFSVAYPLPEKVASAIKAADRISAACEAVELAGFDQKEADKYFGRQNKVDTNGFDLEPWPAPLAEQRFLERFARITAPAA
jgi:5'-deoxynucleotidase YfbR-like HD superfamily hydrolase